MPRKIPATIVTQHPDHARKPYWLDEAFISTRYESDECFRSFSELGATEYKWDWEGKLVDESVLERLYSEHYDYFKRSPIGKEKFLTFRLPNPKVESEFRIGRAFMSIMGAASMTKQLELHSPPLFEVILPMTESADEMLAIQEAFSQMHSLKHDLYRFDPLLLQNLEMIPLFEQVPTIFRSHEILEEYIQKHEKIFGFRQKYIRPYVARSDPALNSGVVPTVLAIKVALSRYKQLEEKTGIKFYPMIGAASLPFRGGLTPFTVRDFAKEYTGIRTTTLQSAFRYDYDIDDVKEGIRKLESLLPKGKAVIISEKDIQQIGKLIHPFERYYRKSVEHIAPLVNEVAGFLPKRRERVQHVGLFGYSRGVGRVKLPRAIGFTAALYSLGVPPEMIGMGRGLEDAKKHGHLPVIEKYYLNIKKDLLRSGKYLNKKQIVQRARGSTAWQEILHDVRIIENYLEAPLAPETDEEQEHLILTNAISKRLQDKLPIGDFIDEAARLRRSLG
ncbi:MAG: phosphoenolpyruvate carboxylase [Candidatus Levybacteria bacterium]|nr:phosphoenolpyruvate carboxylase [Candidatus Levybacteria bacterium]